MIGLPQAPAIRILVATAAPAGALSAGAVAQVPPPSQSISALGAAIEEARRSPFHHRTGTEATASLLLLGHPPAHPPRESLRSPAADSPPSAAAVFVPTLAATYLADAVSFWAIFCSRCLAHDAISYALVATVPVVVPALVAGAFAGRFKPTFLGSALGAGVAFLGMTQMDVNNWPIVFLPAIHAAVTTVAGLARRDRGS